MSGAIGATPSGGISWFSPSIPAWLGCSAGKKGIEGELLGGKPHRVDGGFGLESLDECHGEFFFLVWSNIYHDSQITQFP